MMNGGYGMFGGGGILGIILIAIVAFFAIKYFNENKNDSNVFTNKNDALDVLDQRYARGEIDEEEYNRKKKILKD